MAAHATGDVVRCSTWWPLLHCCSRRVWSLLIMPAGSKKMSQINMGVPNSRKRLNLSNWISPLCLNGCWSYKVAVGKGTLSPLSPGSDMCCGKGHTWKTTGRWAVTSHTKGSFTTPSQVKINNKRSGDRFFSVVAIHSRPQRLTVPEMSQPWYPGYLLGSAQLCQSEAGPSAAQGQDHLCSALASLRDSLQGLSSLSVTLEQGSARIISMPSNMALMS